MRVYSVYTCLKMIAHYEALASNSLHQDNFRALARISASEWRFQLERAQKEEAAE
jgi:hypothetical protein